MGQVHDGRGADGIDRREMLRRSAALGIAVAASTPIVQGLGKVAAFAQVSPSPSPSPEPTAGNVPSNFQILVSFGDQPRIGLKYDGRWDRLPPAPVFCFDGFANPNSVQYANGMSVLDAFQAGGFVTRGDTAYILTGLPDGVQYLDGRTFDGANGASKCGDSVTFVGGQAVFSAPAT
jgi:hypothetical protein